VAQQLGINHQVFNFSEDFERDVRRALRRRPRGRSDTESVHRVQPPPEVRPLPREGAERSASTRWPPVITRRSGPSRAAIGRWPARRRRGQGPVLRTAHAGSGPAGPAPPPRGHDDENRGQVRGGRAGSAHGGQAGQPGRFASYRARVAGRRFLSSRIDLHPGRGGGRGRAAGGRRGPRSSWSRWASAEAWGSAIGQRYVTDVDPATRTVAGRSAWIG